MIREDHLRQRFVVRERHPARITARVRLLHQLEIADDVLIVKRITMKLLEQVERDVRFVLEQRIADHVELIVETDRIDLMAHLLQRRNNVEFSLDFQFFFVGETVQRIRRDEIFVHENDDAQFLSRLKGHTAMR